MSSLPESREIDQESCEIAEDQEQEEQAEVLVPAPKPSFKELLRLGRDFKDKCKGVSVQLLRASNVTKFVLPMLAVVGPQSAATLPMAALVSALAANSERKRIKNQQMAEEIMEEEARSTTVESILTFDAKEMENDDIAVDPADPRACEMCKHRKALCFTLPCQCNTMCLHCGYALVHHSADAASDEKQVFVPCPECKTQIVKILKLTH